MKKLFLALVVGAGICVLTNCEHAKAVDTASETAAAEDPVKQGERLVLTLGCNDCHTPKIMGPQGPQLDTNYLLAGHPAQLLLPDIDPVAAKNWVLFHYAGTAAVGPWGASFAGNLTPDPTGIGNWSEENFVRAMQEGKLKGLENGRPLLPPMPWQGYAHLTDGELHAIFSYLKTLKPVRNLVPQPIPPAF